MRHSRINIKKFRQLHVYAMAVVSKLYFTWLKVKAHPHDSKYIIYTYGGKSADRYR